jgi:hypothetical protein
MSSKLVNLAELLPVTINSRELTYQWENFLKDNIQNFVWDFRVFFQPKDLGDYFKTLIEAVTECIDEVPKYYMLQVFDKRLYKHKEFLNVIHKDADRKSCITIPLAYNIMESVLFYHEIPGLKPEEHRKTNKPWPEKPCQVAKYSDNHPTLVNVQNLHNVRVLDETSPRVLLQISYDKAFDDMITDNQSIWRTF